ncbi:glycosyltransferase family 2 protein [Clostridium perfringens]|uniref:glycosyltransferase family 2 protein n=1 Tax=Clostridium perfringens TaxID=1502 RepID=UPI0023420BBD|nr:glycosyltransferase family 2 protein [Clostridium perfringens]MDC4243647.1 glycosyltransferase family 2 protein [Clostridium perfringens]
MKILVIIPAYNEEKSISKVIMDIYNQRIEDLDILVINDASSDNTKFEAQKLGVNVIDLPINLGIGGAVQTGYIYAYNNKYDVAIQFDGDGQHMAKYLKDMIKAIINENYDMVVGSRFINNSNYKPSIYRKLGINFFSSLVSILGRKKVFDTTSGYRAVNNSVIKEFVEYYPKDYPEVETLSYIIRKGFKVKEIPVEMNYRESGESSITPLKSIYYMLKVTFATIISPDK